MAETSTNLPSITKEYSLLLDLKSLMSAYFKSVINIKQNIKDGNKYRFNFDIWLYTPLGVFRPPKIDRSHMNILFFHPDQSGTRACKLTRENLKSGCGFSGTDTALVEVACGLASKGHRVVVTGAYGFGYITEGVEFVAFNDLFSMGDFLAGVDVYCPLFYLDSHENRCIMDSLGPRAAVWVWFQCFVGDGLLHELRGSGRRVLGSFLSDYMVPHYDPGLFHSSVVIGNGVDDSLFSENFLSTIKNWAFKNKSDRSGKWVFHACWERGGRVAERTHEYVRARDPLAAKGLSKVSYYTPDHGNSGSLSKSELFSLLSQSDYFVYPLVLEDGRVHHDTYGCVILEALAMGVIVVTWNVACIPSVYGDFVLALEPHGDYDPFAKFTHNHWMNSESAVDALGKAVLGLEKDPIRKNLMRSKGVKWARNQTWNSRVSLYEKWLLSSLATS